ncbi:MAG: GNAT family protein [Brachymonas sp.]|nr:GNAT family protein [Brachymonas sp.]
MNGRWAQPVTLSGHGIRLEPLSMAHQQDLVNAVSDGDLWKLPYANVPRPEAVPGGIAQGLQLQEVGWCVALAVIDIDSGKAIGTTSYHDILSAARRLEIGYTWFGLSWQRTQVNTICNFLMMEHAFEALDARMIGWRTDHMNLPFQRAIECLGVQKDGIIRGDRVRSDGSFRDTLLYSMAADAWPEAKARLQTQLAARQVA